jgi:hypothetical protein
MAPAAAYDEIADWYEQEFLGRQAGSDPIGVDRALRDLLGDGEGTCPEIGCGTGVHAATGPRPVRRMLRHAKERLPTARADAEHLPIRGGSVGASHWPLPELLHAFLDAGLILERLIEGGGPAPAVLAVRARKPYASPRLA